MGVRLYPNTKNVASLEILARVPAGTYDRLESIKKQFDFSSCKNHLEYSQLYEKQWNAIYEDKDCHSLDGFLTFGWGKFRPIPETPSYSGSLSNVTLIEELFYINGIDADPMLCEGVHWC